MDSELKSVQLESVTVTAGAGGSAPGASRRRPIVNLKATLAIPRSRSWTGSPAGLLPGP